MADHDHTARTSPIARGTTSRLAFATLLALPLVGCAVEDTLSSVPMAALAEAMPHQTSLSTAVAPRVPT